METNKDYLDLINRHAPPSSSLKNCIKAFLFGGAITGTGELIANLFLMTLDEKDAYLSVTLLLIVSASVLTALGIFDKIARHAGGGTIVPVTGFSNSITSAAIDSRSEGYILGVGAKIFTVCGPVLLYGTLAGTVYGVIYWLCGLF